MCSAPAATKALVQFHRGALQLGTLKERRRDEGQEEEEAKKVLMIPMLAFKGDAVFLLLSFSFGICTVLLGWSTASWPISALEMFYDLFYSCLEGLKLNASCLSRVSIW